MNTVSRYILDQLSAFGIQRMYGVAGDTQLHLVAETAAHSIEFVPVCQENSAGFMAAAESMLTGKTAVCLATSGPGMANMLNGLGEAYGDKVSVLAITGQVDTKKIGTEAKQYLEQQVMLRPLANYSAEVAEAQGLSKVLPLALLKTQSRKQLAHISIPKDVVSQVISAQVMASPIGLNPQCFPAPSALKAALELISNSQRPLIMAGVGARAAMPEIVKLAHSWGAGIITSLGAKGALGGSEELYLHGLGQGGSEPASQLLTKCDLLLVVGCNWWPTDYAVADAARVVQIDLNPEAVGCGIAPHVALIGDAHEVVWQLRSELNSQADPTWRAEIIEAMKLWNQHLLEEVTQSEPMHPGAVMHELEELKLEEAIYTVDTGDHTVWFNRHFHGLCQRVLFSGKWRSMGFALPAAIAAGLTDPTRRVICITGDGGLNMVLSELATMVRENLPITVLVLNNHTYAMEKNRMENAGLAVVGVDLPPIDYVKVSEACGLKAEMVTDITSLRQALTKAISHPGPYLIAAEVGTPYLPHVKL